MKRIVYLAAALLIAVTGCKKEPKTSGEEKPVGKTPVTAISLSPTDLTLEIGEKVVITADMHMGDADATAWGCDLTYDYVKINADYRS